ncbi:MAG: hypothetical protein FJ045_05430, partial [Crenarchaeota archaeon]|nr:hypothetical protein [Thermoproteota archaeon]
MRFDPPSAKTLNRAVSLVLSASKTAFADSLECITLKGSAIKGDFIRGYSDLDFHVFLKPEAMDGEKSPKLDEAIRFQKTFGDVEPEDFDASQFQIYFINSEKYPSDWIPPVKGTFKVYWGILPLVAKEADDSTYVRFAKQFLSDVTEDKKKLVERFVDKPDTLVPTVVRLLGATVKGHMYSVAVLLTEKPKYAFKMKLDALIPLVEKGLESKGHFSA